MNMIIRRIRREYLYLILLVFLLFLIYKCVFFTHTTFPTLRPPSYRNGCREISIQEIIDHEKISIHNEQFHQQHTSPIPRIVHYIYHSIHLPQQYENLARHCIRLNPTYTFILWTDEDAFNAIKYMQSSWESMLPNNASGTLHEIAKTHIAIERSDVIRLMLMYFFGGIYMDLDMECRQPFDKVFSRTLTSTLCLLDKEEPIQTLIMHNINQTVMNNFMVCPPRHTFFSFVLSNLQQSNGMLGDTIHKTGPIFLNKLFQKYNQQYTCDENYQIIEAADSRWFSPFVDSVPWLRGLCTTLFSTMSEVRRNACKIGLPKYLENVTSRDQNALLIHRFLHLGYTSGNARISSRFVWCSLKEKNIRLPCLN